MFQAGKKQEDSLLPNQPAACVEVPAANQSTTWSLASPPSRNLVGNCTSSGVDFEISFREPNENSHSKAGSSGCNYKAVVVVRLQKGWIKSTFLFFLANIRWMKQHMKRCQMP